MCTLEVYMQLHVAHTLQTASAMLLKRKYTAHHRIQQSVPGVKLAKTWQRPTACEKHCHATADCFECMWHTQQMRPTDSKQQAEHDLCGHAAGRGGGGGAGRVCHHVPQCARCMAKFCATACATLLLGNAVLCCGKQAGAQVYGTASLQLLGSA